MAVVKGVSVLGSLSAPPARQALQAVELPEAMKQADMRSAIFNLLCIASLQHGQLENTAEAMMTVARRRVRVAAGG